MTIKIAEFLELDANNAEHNAYSAGVEAYMKTAGLNESEEAEFLEAAKALDVNSKTASQTRDAFDAGLLKFAADAGLTEDQYITLVNAATAIAQSND